MIRSSRSGSRWVVLAAIALAFAVAAPSQAALKLKKGDHIVYLGNALADRMQHDGWVETYIQAANPKLDLVFRNHGFSGDMVNKRPRNKGFIPVDEYLKISKASVIFAFFGYNESFDNKPDNYKNDLVKWANETKGKDFGAGAPQIVLFSPIYHENLHTPNLPDGTENNKRLAAYAKATEAAAKEAGVTYVDLFAATKLMYAKAKKPLTYNGIHLTYEGNRELAKFVTKELFGTTLTTADAKLEKIRAAVMDKNWHWYNRYRATDGNDVWGGRSKLHGNRANLMHELKMLDVMTANRDKVIHAAIAGRTIKATDSNVPKALPVKSNFKQNGKVGSLKYMPAKETAASFEMAEGLEAKVFASEEMFPELINPVQMAVDTKGRLWAAAWPTYPKWEPLKPMNDALLIFPDENGDGVADKCITFAHIHNPTGFEFWNGGVIVVSAPDIWFLKDTDGDDKADVKIPILSGIDSADTHHTANCLVYGPGGYIYYQRGVFHVSNVETPWQKGQVHGNSAMYRFNPRTHEYAMHAGNSPNPHGISFGRWGYHYATDGTGGRAYQVRPTGKGFKMRGLLKKKVRPVPSSGVLSSAHFPERNNGNFLICNAIGFLGIKQYKLKFNNGDANGEEIEDLLVSKKDRNFRPTDIEVGVDGALYVSDWSNAIVGHMQHNIRDPARDHKHGRIYRVTAKGRPLQKKVPIDGQPIAKLLDNLAHPINNIRYLTRIELSERPTKDVIAEAQKWVKQWDPKNPDHAHHILEILWLHQQHNVVNRQLLDVVKNSPVDHARIAAATVEQFWKGR